MSDSHHSSGRYEVSAELGRGSMGIVCHAHDTLMGREVAIKTILLPNGLPADEKLEFQQRFLREAQAAGRLSHPGIVTVYDFNQEAETEQPFIAMEYVPGFTLHELIDRDRPLDPDWAVAMADTLADALSTAHRAGVVHRDLKPANILVRASDGAAKISDFGLARINLSDLTHAGTTYGSPAYMAPERIKGKRADGRSDLFSLAVIFYETLCAKRPFGGDDFTSTCYSIVNDPHVPIRSRAPALPIAFESFFQRALAKDPDDRFQDGASFRAALEELSHPLGRFDAGAETMRMALPEEATLVPEAAAPAIVDGTTAAFSVPKRWLAIGGGALLLILISFFAGWVLSRGRPDVHPIALLETSPQLTLRETSPELTLSEPTAASSAAPDPTAAVVVAPPQPTIVETPAPVETPPAPAPPETPEMEPVQQVAEPPTETPVKNTPSPEPATAEVEIATAPEIESVAPPEIEEVGVTPLPAVAPIPATLEVNIKSSLKAGTLTLLVDGEVVYSEELSGDTKKLNRVYKNVLGKSQQQLETRLEIPAGDHSITALAYSEAKSRQYEASLEVKLEPGEARSLEIVTGKTFGRRMTMKLD